MNQVLTNQNALDTERQAAPISITRLTATELAECIRTGKLSSREAVEAHIRRIQEVNPTLNAMVVELFEQARSEAASADAARARGEQLGPLHGVPISLKEEFAVAGTPSTFGLQNRAARKLSADGGPAERLRKAGAIILGKTNVAQLLIYHESDNPVYGRTNNPWNPARTPGGSSGGEAALVASGGSPLGLGSDIGGSVRVPAHFSGIFGLKPTAGRLPSTDQPGHVFEPLHDIVSQPGPLARNVADLALMMRVLAPLSTANGKSELDWQSYTMMDLSKLRMGIYTDDGYFPAAPALRRAVREAGQALKGMGVQVVEWSPPDVPQAMRLFFGIMSADRGAWFKHLLGDGKRDRRTAGLLQLMGMPRAAKPTVLFLLRLLGQRGMAGLISSLGTIRLERYAQDILALAAYRERFRAALDQAGIDALICPPHALPALTHGSSYYLSPAASYSMLYNVLGMPAGVAPFTRVRPGEESDRMPGADIVQRIARAVEIGSAGLPVGVQVVARHWREDIVLALLVALEMELRSRPDYQAMPAL